jgi:hypothetical protein
MHVIELLNNSRAMCDEVHASTAACVASHDFSCSVYAWVAAAGGLLGATGLPIVLY